VFLFNFLVRVAYFIEELKIIKLAYFRLAIIKMLRVRINDKKLSLFAKQDFVVNLYSKLSYSVGQTAIMVSSLNFDS
jgi:hypothetical protein